MGFNVDNTSETGTTGASFADNLFQVYDSANPTTRFKFDIQGVAGTLTRFITQSSVNQDISFPDGAGNWTVLSEALAQIVSNKTLGNTNVVTLRDDRFTLQDNGDSTKQAVFDLAGITTATTRTWSFPDFTDTFVGLTAAQSPTNKTFDNTNTVTLRDDRFTLQDNGDTTKQVVFQLSGLTTATTRTWTFPDFSDTFVGLTAAQSPTNKTFDNTNTFTIRDDRFTLQDNADTTKQAVFQLSGITTATTRTYTLRDESGTLQMQRLTTKGDLLAYSTTDSRLPVGSDGKVLKADSSAASGLSWDFVGVPVGSVFPYAGSSAPSNFLLCDGSAISRTTYSVLFSIIGTTFGSGDGSTTFNIPNTQGLFLRGAGSQTISGKTYTGTAGTTQGDQLQGHYHSIGGFNPYTSGGATFSFNIGASAAGSTAMTVTSPTTDGVNGTPRTGDETRPVNLGINFIIKAL